jgi:recombination protein RecR
MSGDPEAASAAARDSARDIEHLIALMARLPGLGPRSARRAVLHLLRRRDTVMQPLAEVMAGLARSVRDCRICGNLSAEDVCNICRDPVRNAREICVVESVADLWALERAEGYRGRYHVLGGTLSALDAVGPEELRLPELMERLATDGVEEVILALNATVDGQTTAHYIADLLAPTGVRVTGLAQGVPLGGELDYLDAGTIAAAMRARRNL